MLAVIAIVCCFTVHSVAEVSFESATAKGKHGTIELDVSLSSVFNHNNNITIYTSCIDKTTGFEITQEPINAGETYICTILGYINNQLEKIMTNEFISSTGIPSQPIVKNCITNGNGTLMLQVESEYPGVLLNDSSLKIYVTVDGTVESFKYMHTNKIHISKMSDEVTVQIINRYGSSTLTKTQCGPLPSSSVTPSPTDEPENMDIIYIIIGVLAPVVFLIIIALVVSDALCKKKKCCEVQFCLTRDAKT